MAGHGIHGAAHVASLQYVTARGQDTEPDQSEYDRLGVDQSLRMLWSAMDRKRLVALDQYLPMLDRIANNESYMHAARAKAAELAESIRAKQP